MQSPITTPQYQNYELLLPLLLGPDLDAVVATGEDDVPIDGGQLAQAVRNQDSPLPVDLVFRVDEGPDRLTIAVAKRGPSAPRDE